MAQDKLNLDITPGLIKQDSKGRYIECCLSSNGYTRQAKLYEDGKMLLKKGAYLEDLTDCGKDFATVVNLRNKYANNIQDKRINIDLWFNTPSGAASFCCGSNRNGWGSIENKIEQGFKNKRGDIIDIYRAEKSIVKKYLEDNKKYIVKDTEKHFELITSETLFAEYTRENKFISICIKDSKFIILNDTSKIESEYKIEFNTFEELCESLNIEKSTAGWTLDTGKSLGDYLKLVEKPVERKSVEQEPVEKQPRVIELSDDTLRKQAKYLVEELKLIDKDAQTLENNSESITEKEYEKYSLDDFNKAVQGVDATVLEKVLSIKKALLLMSPPGTGKTTTARELAKYIIGEDNPNRYKLVSFNQTTSYTDVIGGYQNIGVDGKENWQVEKGSLANFCEKASVDKGNKYIYIIDEINRANTEAVLGEAITALEQRDTPVDTNAKFELTIPNNVYIVATMNSADSSITELDNALLDRFAIYNMPSIKLRPEEIKPKAESNLLTAISLVLDALEEINSILEKDIYKGKENRIGNRALYTDYNSIEELRLLIEYDLEPKIETKLKSLDDYQKKDIRSIIKRVMKQLE